MSATAQYMLLGASTSLESIGSVATSAASHRASSYKSCNEYTTLLKDNDVHFRMIENQFGTAQAERYHQSNTSKESCVKSKQKEETSGWAACKAKFKRNSIGRRLVKVCRAISSRTLHRRSADTSDTNKPATAASQKRSRQRYPAQPLRTEYQMSVDLAILNANLEIPSAHHRTVPDYTIPDYSVPDNKVIDNAVTNNIVADCCMSECSIPDNTVADYSTPDYSMPDYSVPDCSMPGCS